MSIELKDIELVDRYLSGNLDAASLQAFQSRLQSDTALQELLSDFQSTNELVKANEYAQLQAQLDSFSYDAAPWWQSNVAKIAGVVGVAAVVTTAVWFSSTSDKPVTAKENNTVTVQSSKVQKEQVAQSKENPVAAEKSSADKPSVKKEEQHLIFIPSILVPDVPVNEEHSAPLSNPVAAPAGPAAVPPQRDSAVSSSPKGTNTNTTPAPDSDPAPLPDLSPAFPAVTNGYVQVPGSNWTYPEHMKNGNLHIVNESGALINDITLNASTDSWNGTDRYGNVVPAGLYFYQYTDAATGKHYAGTITVVY